MGDGLESGSEYDHHLTNANPQRAVSASPLKETEFARGMCTNASYRSGCDVRTFSVERSHGRNRYINFLYLSATPSRTWQMIQKQLRHRTLGIPLRRSLIVVCQGSRGWDNYRLLHHFDERLLDKLTGR